MNDDDRTGSMQPSRIVLIAIVAVILIVVSITFWNGAGIDPVPGEVATVGSADTPDGTSTEIGVPEHAGAARRTISDPDDLDGGPEFLRALSGFRGRVVEPRGTGVGGAEVIVLRVDDGAFWRGAVDLMATTNHLPRLVAGRTRTQADGGFVITGVWPGSFYAVQVGRGSEWAATRIVPRTPGPGELVDLGDIHVGGRGAIIGRVLDDRDQPIAGATIRAAAVPEHLLKRWPLERLDLESPVIYVSGDASHVLQIPRWVRDRLEELALETTKSGADGSFRLTGVRPDRVAVFVTAPERLPHLHATAPVASGAETNLGDIVLRVGERVRGRVVDDRGRAIENAEVLVGQGTAMVPVVFAARVDPTGSDGRFECAGFRPGHVVVAARRDAGSPWVIRDGQSTTGESVVRLPSAVSVTVRVFSKTGARVDDPEFKLLPSAPDSHDLDLSLFGFRSSLPLGRRLDKLDDGRFRFRDVQQGRYLLLVRAAGHAIRAFPFTVEADRELAIELRPELPFVVVVTDDRGESVPDAQIHVQTKGDHPRIPRLPIPCGRTGEDGRLRVTQAMSREITVRAVHPAHGVAKQEVNLPADIVHIRLQSEGSVEGRVTEAGKPPKPDAWSLAIRPTKWTSSEILALPRLTTPDDDGRFRFAGLAPGRYELSVVESVDTAGLGLALDPHAFRNRLRSRDRHEVVPVHAGKTTTVDIDTEPGFGGVGGPAARVSGTVVVNGRPAAGLEVRGWHRRWLNGPVGADGRFDLGEVPLGHAGIYVVDPEAGQGGRFEMLWWDRVHVQTERPVTLVIDLQLGSLSGRVVHADGHGVPGCRIRLRGKSTGPGSKSTYTKFHGFTDRRGAFAFRNLPAGTYSAVVWDQRNGRAELEDIVVRGGAETGSVTVPLRRVVSVSGRVEMRLLGPEPPRWSWIRLYGMDGDGRYVSKEGGSKVRRDGTFRIDGVPPGRYEVSIGAMHEARDGSRVTRMFVHQNLLTIGDQGLRDVRLRPVPRPPKKTDPPRQKEGSSGRPTVPRSGAGRRG